MTANRLSCEDKNECDWQPCGRGGRCFNVESGGGYWCDCPLDGFRCDNCSCDEEPNIKHSSAKIGLGGDALAIIILCLLFYLSKTFMFCYLFCFVDCKHLSYKRFFYIDLFKSISILITLKLQYSKRIGFVMDSDIISLKSY